MVIAKCFGKFIVRVTSLLIKSVVKLELVENFQLL